MVCRVAFLSLFCGVAIEVSIFPALKCFEPHQITHDSHVQMSRSGILSATETQEIGLWSPQACCLHHHLLDYFESHWVLTQLPNPGIPNCWRHIIKQEIRKHFLNQRSSRDNVVFLSLGFSYHDNLTLFCREYTFCFKCISPHYQSMSNCVASWRPSG